MEGTCLIDGNGELWTSGEKIAYSETEYRGNVLRSLRTKDSKLICAEQDPRDRFADIEFYDMVVDRAESQNISGTGDFREASLQRILQDFLVLAKATENQPESIAEIPVGLRERLKSLGYLE
jgi:hypothetical protein